MDKAGLDGGKDYKYCRELTRIANREQVAIVIELDDLAQFVEKEEFIDRIEINVKR